jgi:hypothetical protein
MIVSNRYRLPTDSLKRLRKMRRNPRPVTTQTSGACRRLQRIFAGLSPLLRGRTGTISATGSTPPAGPRCSCRAVPSFRNQGDPAARGVVGMRGRGSQNKV